MLYKNTAGSHRVTMSRNRTIWTTADHFLGCFCRFPSLLNHKSCLTWRTKMKTSSTNGLSALAASLPLTRLTKLHEAVGRVQFVVFEKIYKCLFIPNCTRKIIWLRINNFHEKYEIGYHNCAEAKRATSAKIINSNRAFSQNNCVRSKQ